MMTTTGTTPIGRRGMNNLVCFTNLAGFTFTDSVDTGVYYYFLPHSGFTTSEESHFTTLDLPLSFYHRFTTLSIYHQ